MTKPYQTSPASWPGRCTIKMKCITCNLRTERYGHRTLEMIALTPRQSELIKLKLVKAENIGAFQALPCQDQADQALEPVMINKKKQLEPNPPSKRTPTAGTLTFKMKID